MVFYNRGKFSIKKLLKYRPLDFKSINLNTLMGWNRFTLSNPIHECYCCTTTSKNLIVNENIMLDLTLVSWEFMENDVFKRVSSNDEMIFRFILDSVIVILYRVIFYLVCVLILNEKK